MATAERDRRREVIEQEVQRKLLAGRDRHRIEGRTDARYRVVIDMMLDIEDDVNELREELRNTTRRINDHVERSQRRY